MEDYRMMLKLGNSQDRILVLLFLLFFGLMALWQFKKEFRSNQSPILGRWLNHLGLAFVNLLVLRILFAGSVLWAAQLASRYNWGLFHQIDVPLLFSMALTVIFLDWMVYYLHRIYHAIPLLWKIHRIHHTDTEVETSTSVRFHPLEQVITALWKGLFIVLLGAPLSGVFAYEALFLIANLFNHANARLPKRWEPLVRLLFVTPEMHRVHHSSEPKETNSNFGFILSLWDRALLTYKADSQKGQEGVVLGLEVFREEGDQTIVSLLKQPFLGPEGRFEWSNLWN
jgi:sterol desaturase/sphingolipid hydroxylase (fatty acid hydroxylase superfamily)